MSYIESYFAFFHVVQFMKLRKQSVWILYQLVASPVVNSTLWIGSVYWYFIRHSCIRYPTFNLCYIIFSRNDMLSDSEGNDRVGVAIQEAFYICKTYEQ